MFALTRQEQLVIVSLIVALLVGAGVKQWRENHVPAPQPTAKLSKIRH
jgi:hypothetical protein